MAIKRGRKKLPGMLELNMTAMCDVAFLLLIYLILTTKPMIVLANLDVNRPSPDPNQKTPEKITGLVEIMVFSDAYVVNTKRVLLPGLKAYLKELARLDTTQTVLIKCAWDSPHVKLIDLLDICAEERFTNLSVMSM